MARLAPIQSCSQNARWKKALRLDSRPRHWFPSLLFRNMPGRYQPAFPSVAQSTRHWSRPSGRLCLDFLRELQARVHEKTYPKVEPNDVRYEEERPAAR